MGHNLQKFYLLLWKNFMLQKRHPFQTFMEIIAPVVCCSLLVILRSNIMPEKHAAKLYSPFEPGVTVLNNNPLVTTVYWAPQNGYFHNVVVEAISAFNKKHGCNLKSIPVADGDVLDNVLLHNHSTFMGIEFDEDTKFSFSFPPRVNIVFRFPAELRFSIPNSNNDNDYSWVTYLLYPVHASPGPRDYDANEGAKPDYNAEGFLAMQLELGNVLIKHFSNNRGGEVKIQMQRFPHPAWIEDDLLVALRLFVSLVIMLSTVYACINTVRNVTVEKEKQLKEAMRIMGLPNWLHWTAWFVKTVIMMFIGQVLVVIVFKITWFKCGAIFPLSNPFVILYFLLFFVAATTTFCFAITVFFSKANLASTVAGLIWFLSYFPYSFLQPQYETMSLIEKLLACLCSTSAMGYGFQIMLMYEGLGIGMQWSNIDQYTSPDDTLSLNLVIMMLFFDAILYMCFTIYVEGVFPGETGIPKVWYFPFTKSYWFGTSQYVMTEPTESPTESQQFFEQEPENLVAGIRIVNLQKIYSNKKTAVKHLNLNMYQHQITVLLGHNGAGKTTTMSMLTGLIRPTNGTAFINGYDIRIDKKRARKSIGLCPQYNVLFDELTVAEHLYFFSRLKGVKRKNIPAEISKYVVLLELGDKEHAQSGTLSGGMQRKLSVGIALCGDSAVVMLDEPTAGMDPAARRALWDLLISQKEGRTMLLSTHFMDEADLLGDRIAIMAGGTLQCCGSSFFLKKKYGSGYHLIMEKAPNCNVANVTKLLQRHIPSLRLKSEAGNELTYLLTEEHVSVFKEMLNDLETNSKYLEIESYGISLTTLEEVFMMVGADHRKQPQENQTANLRTSEAVEYIVRSGRRYDRMRNENYEMRRLTGFWLWLNQFHAMTIKRALTVYRAWELFLIQNVLAVLFISLAIIVVRNLKFYDDLPALKIHLASYNHPTTLLTNNHGNPYAERYARYLHSHGKQLLHQTDGNMAEIINNEITKNYLRVRQRYICGASYTDSSAIAWFNTEAFHSAPLCLQMILNSVLKTYAGDEFEVRFVNRPLKFLSETQYRELTQGHNMGFQIGFNLGFGMAFVSSFYMIFYIKERASKAKHIQFVSGARVIAFWAPSFVIDMLTFMFTSILVCLAILCFDEDGFNTFDEIKHVFFALTLFAYVMLPMTYLAAFRFDVPSSGYTKMSLISVFFGVAGFLAVQMMRLPQMELNNVADKLHLVLLVAPHYSLSAFIRDKNIMFSTRRICKKLTNRCIKGYGSAQSCTDLVCLEFSKCCSKMGSYYDWYYPGVGQNVFYSVIEGTVLIILLLLIEYKVIRKIRHNLRRTKYVPPDTKLGNIEVDVDVQDENDFIRHAPFEKISEYNLFMRDVSKCYGKFVAVNNICLAVKSHECFGLLGVNGAGKTTTFKVMTGDIKCTSGDAWVKGVPLKGNLKKIQTIIGYCPQFDALLDDLTCRETLIIFAMLRGFGKTVAKVKAQKMAVEFDFTSHLDTPVFALSGGNKRKLSTAISVLGNPDVLYLDEPTTGMDPATKRFLWDALCKIRDKGTTIILTSHSMEECEALCTKMAIMVNGMFVCLGSSQHLKTKFSDGYTLMIKLQKGVSTAEVEKYIKQQLPTSELREKHHEMLTYYILQEKNLRWSYLFRIMESAKVNLSIEDYSIGQSTLEQVFLSFTKHQSEKYKVKGRRKKKYLEVLK